MTDDPRPEVAPGPSAGASDRPSLRLALYDDAFGTVPTLLELRRFSDLAGRLRRPPAQKEKKEDGQLLSRGAPGAPRPGKRRPSTLAPYQVVVDVDGSGVPPARASASLRSSGHPHAIYTTHSHGDPGKVDPAKPGPWRYRIYASLIAEGSAALRSSALSVADAAGIEPEAVDPGSWETQRGFYVPAVHPSRSGQYEHHAWVGDGEWSLVPEPPSETAEEVAPPAAWEGSWSELVEALWAIPAELQEEQPGRRDHWIKVGQCLHATGDERAEDEWDRWSQRDGPYSAEGQRQAWRSFSDRPGGRTPATIFRLAREHGWRPRGTPPAEDFAEEVLGASVFGRPDFVLSPRGGISRTFENAVHAIETLGLDLRYDQMGDRILMCGPGREALLRDFPLLEQEVGDVTLNAVRCALARRPETSACASWKPATLSDALDAVAHHRAFNPLVDWLRSLRWDGVERIDRWLVDYCGSPDTPYVRTVGSIFLRAAVARAFVPSVKFDYLTILESPQGYLKSSMILALGGEFSREGLRDLRSKDVIDDLRGAWIVELEELAVTRREDVQTLKSFLSRTADRARLAYGRRSRTHVRRFVFVGTTNDATYLRDDTGNRRFLPVKVTREIDLDRVRRDRAQLFAEAVARWDADPRAESLALPRELWQAAAEEQEQRRSAHPWEEVIEKWLDQPEQAALAGIQASEILERALHKPVAQQTKHDREQVGSVMRLLGWRHQSFRDGGKVRKGFVCPEAEIAWRRKLAGVDVAARGILQ